MRRAVAQFPKLRRHSCYSRKWKFRPRHRHLGQSLVPGAEISIVSVVVADRCQMRMYRWSMRSKVRPRRSRRNGPSIRRPDVRVRSAAAISAPQYLFAIEDGARHFAGNPLQDRFAGPDMVWITADVSVIGLSKDLRYVRWRGHFNSFLAELAIREARGALISALQLRRSLRRVDARFALRIPTLGKANDDWATKSSMG